MKMTIGKAFQSHVPHSLVVVFSLVFLVRSGGAPILPLWNVVTLQETVTTFAFSWMVIQINNA